MSHIDADRIYIVDMSSSLFVSPVLRVWKEDDDRFEKRTHRSKGRSFTLCEGGYTRGVLSLIPPRICLALMAIYVIVTLTLTGNFLHYEGVEARVTIMHIETHVKSAFFQFSLRY
jgi:hypothetical protein